MEVLFLLIECLITVGVNPRLIGKNASDDLMDFLPGG
jgi:hypothetical protein